MRARVGVVGSPRDVEVAGNRQVGGVRRSAVGQVVFVDALAVAAIGDRHVVLDVDGEGAAGRVAVAVGGSVVEGEVEAVLAVVVGMVEVAEQLEGVGAVAEVAQRNVEHHIGGADAAGRRAGITDQDVADEGVEHRGAIRGQATDGVMAGIGDGDVAGRGRGGERHRAVAEAAMGGRVAVVGAPADIEVGGHGEIRRMRRGAVRQVVLVDKAAVAGMRGRDVVLDGDAKDVAGRIAVGIGGGIVEGESQRVLAIGGRMVEIAEQGKAVGAGAVVVQRHHEHMVERRIVAGVADQIAVDEGVVDGVAIRSQAGDGVAAAVLDHDVVGGNRVLERDRAIGDRATVMIVRIPVDVQITGNRRIMLVMPIIVIVVAVFQIAFVDGGGGADAGHRHVVLHGDGEAGRTRDIAVGIGGGEADVQRQGILTTARRMIEVVEQREGVGAVAGVRQRDVEHLAIRQGQRAAIVVGDAPDLGGRDHIELHRDAVRGQHRRTGRGGVHRVAAVDRSDERHAAIVAADAVDDVVVVRIPVHCQ